MHKVRPGNPLEISAGSFNSFVDAARHFQGRQYNYLAQMRNRIQQPGIIRVCNDSEERRNRFEVLGLNDPVIMPEQDSVSGEGPRLAEWQNRTVMKGTVPNLIDGHYGRFAILQHTLEPYTVTSLTDPETGEEYPNRPGEEDTQPGNSIGPAVVDGVSPVKVFMRSPAHVYADVRYGDPTQLQSFDHGAAQILWHEEIKGSDYPKTVWAKVRLGPPSGMAFFELAQDWIPPEPDLTTGMYEDYYKIKAAYLNIVENEEEIIISRQIKEFGGEHATCTLWFLPPMFFGCGRHGIEDQMGNIVWAVWQLGYYSMNSKPPEWKFHPHWQIRGGDFKKIVQGQLLPTGAIEDNFGDVRLYWKNYADLTLTELQDAGDYDFWGPEVPYPHGVPKGLGAWDIGAFNFAYNEIPGNRRVVISYDDQENRWSIIGGGERSA